MNFHWLFECIGMVATGVFIVGAIAIGLLALLAEGMSDRR